MAINMQLLPSKNGMASNRLAKISGRGSSVAPGAPENHHFLTRGSRPTRPHLACAAGTAEIAEDPVAGSGVTRSTLENGLRVVTEHVPGVRSIAIGVLVDAGSRDERPGQEGLAHLSEHLMFQGTSSRDGAAIARFIDAAGGAIGAFTARDYTCYYATVVDDYRYHALDLLGDILLNSIFPPDKVEAQKHAILCEILGGQDAPEHRAHERLKAHAWAGHSLGRPVTGSPESLATLTREDVIYFVHQHYCPARIVIAAAGNLEHRDFVANVRDAFWRLLGDSPIPAGGRPPRFTGGVVAEDRPLAQSYFALGLPAAAYAHRDRYALHLLAKTLGGGVSSRLYRRIREEKGLVYRIDADYHAYRDGGMLVIEGCTSPEALITVVAAVATELARLASGEEEATGEELTRAKTQIVSRHLLGSEDTQTRMSRLATQELYFGSPVPAADIVSTICAVESTDLVAVGRALLPRRGLKPALAVVGPDASSMAAGLERALGFTRDRDSIRRKPCPSTR
jgi:predicted Zn-dependent peptidase